MPKNKKKTLKTFKLLPIIVKTLIVVIFLFLLPGVLISNKASESDTQEIEVKPPPTPALYPKFLQKETAPLLTAEGIYIIDLDSNVPLYEKNANVKLAPASTTKIITALVALDVYKPDDILTVNTVINEGRVMGLLPNEKMTVENLIYGALVHSANDAAYALAENYPGGVEAFVVKMNERVEKLGLKNTHLTNPIGFEDDNHYTTAYDLTQLSRLALKNSLIKKIIATKSITVSDSDYNLFHRLDNVNTLLGRVPGVAGVKTGWTEQAKEVLATLVKRNDHEVLVVILKSDDRFGETEKLINWIFNNYQWEDFATQSAQLL